MIKDRMIYYLLPFYCISVFLYTFFSTNKVLSSFEPHSTQLFAVNLGILSIPWLFTIYIWYKMRFYDVQDFFHIREELIV